MTEIDEAAIATYIAGAFAGVVTVSADGATFFLCDPEGKHPFATIVTRDTDYDHASDLDRPGAFRLNVGVSKETFGRLFPPVAADPVDFTAVDRLFPHPVYGSMYWACVINPSPATFEQVKPLLAEAHALSLRRHGTRER